MNEIKTTEGLILKKIKIGDFDSLLAVLTKEYGKINVFAKSSRKPKAKLGFHSEPGSISRIHFIPQRNRDGYLLTGATSIWKPDFLKLSRLKNKIFYQGLNLIERLTVESIQEPKKILTLFNLAKEYFKKISSERVKNKHLILYQISFTLKLLDSAGFRPNLKKCANCKKEFQKGKNIYYDNESGGLICCQFAYSSSLGSQKISFDSLKLANYLLQEPLEKIKKLNIQKEIAEKTWKLALNHLEYCLE